MKCSICGSKKHERKDCCCIGKWNSNYPHNENDCVCLCHPGSRQWEKEKEEKIHKNCLDKRQVREVVTAYLCKWNCKRSDKIKKMRDGILKELDLEVLP